MANAHHNQKLALDTLWIAEIYVDEGPTLKRYRPRAQGRAYRIRKRTSHITVTVESRSEERAGAPTRRFGRRPRTGQRARCHRQSQARRSPLVGQKVNPHGFRLGITTRLHVALVCQREDVPRLHR